jgi:hypothetical protein
LPPPIAYPCTGFWHYGAMEADRKRHRAKECKQICLQIKMQEGGNFNIFYVFCVIGTEKPLLSLHLEMPLQLQIYLQPACGFPIIKNIFLRFN